MRRMPDNFRPGDTIRHDWMNDVGRVLNAHSARLYAIPERSITDANNLGRQRVGGAGGGGVSMPTSLTFTESSRTSASRVGTDSASNTETYDVATQIVMSASSGGVSYSWTFRYAAT